MTDDELVEKVARGICETPGYEDDWVHPVMFADDAHMSDEACRDIYRDMARAAIAVMREAGWGDFTQLKVVTEARGWGSDDDKKPAASEGAG